MSAKKRSPKRRALRRKISESIERTQTALAKKREESPPDKKTAAAQNSKSQSGSRKELKYQPHRSKGTKFLDPKRRAYKVSEAGELQALDKPRSREKRRREERNQKTTKSD